MKNQYLKIQSWMVNLGLTANELLAFAAIHAYTLFKGCFDGDRVWLSIWSCTAVAGMDEVIDSLISKGCIRRTASRYSTDAYKSLFSADGLSAGVPGSAVKTRSAGDTSDMNGKYHIIDSIDSIETKDKKDSIDSMDRIDSINSIETKDEKGSIDSLDSINSIATKKDNNIDSIDTIASEDRFSNTADNKERGSSAVDPELMELIAPYKAICEVPLQELIEKMNILEERKAKRKAETGL